MAFCISCGQMQADGTKFCRFCGGQQPGDQLIARLRMEAEAIRYQMQQTWREWLRITIVENYVISKLCVSLKITKLIKKNKM